MTDIKLKVIQREEPLKERVSSGELRDKPIKQEKIEIEKVNLSKNIQNFDSKVNKYKTANPYDYNSISLAKRSSVAVTPTATQMILDPTYNTIGKFLGVDTVHEWGVNYDKVKTIVDWAKSRSGAKTIEGLMNFLNGASQFVPSFGMNHKKIDQIHLYATLQLQGGNK